MPLFVPQPKLHGAFHAQRASDTDQTSLTDNAFNKAALDQASLDPLSYFDTTNNRYLPLIAGWYFIYGSGAGSAGAAGSPFVKIMKNGSGSAATGNFPSATSGVQISKASALIQFNGSTDYVELHVFLPTGTTTIRGDHDRTYMGGWLVSRS